MSETRISTATTAFHAKKQMALDFAAKVFKLQQIFK